MTPACDLVPAPVLSLERRDLAMTVGTCGRTATIYNLLSRCERFGLAAEGARKEIDAVVATVRTWREHFRASGVSPGDIEYIAPAFLPDCFFLEKPVEG
jgi:serine/threonine-protein kinase HipA